MSLITDVLALSGTDQRRLDALRDGRSPGPWSEYANQVFLIGIIDELARRLAGTRGEESEDEDGLTPADLRLLDRLAFLAKSEGFDRFEMWNVDDIHSLRIRIEGLLPPRK